MRSNIIATYSHDDREVRFLMRYTFVTAFLSGVTITGILFTVFG